MDSDVLFVEKFVIMVVISIVYKRRMLISDIFMKNPFVNSAVIGLSNGEMVRFMS